jgi:hypothetical protein
LPSAFKSLNAFGVEKAQKVQKRNVPFSNYKNQFEFPKTEKAFPRKKKLSV